MKPLHLWLICLSLRPCGSTGCGDKASKDTWATPVGSISFWSSWKSPCTVGQFGISWITRCLGSLAAQFSLAPGILSFTDFPVPLNQMPSGVRAVRNRPSASPVEKRLQQQASHNCHPHNRSPCRYHDLSEAEAPFYYSVHWGKPGHAVLSTQFINTIYSRSIPLSGLTQCPETPHWERRLLLKRKKCQFQPSPLKWNKRNKVNK